MKMRFNGRFQLLKTIAITFVCLTLGLYLYKFYSYKLSSKPTDWGVFGDYFGGVINPVISFLNLLLTYYIAQMVSAFSEIENNKQVLIQNKIIKSQLRYDALKDFQKEINSQFERIFDPAINDDVLKNNIQQAIKIINGFHMAYKHLFVENPMFHIRLVADLQTAIVSIREQETLKMNLSRQFTRKENSGILEPLANSKDSLLSNLNREIIRRLDENLLV